MLLVTVMVVPIIGWTDNFDLVRGGRRGRGDLAGAGRLAAVDREDPGLAHADGEGPFADTGEAASNDGKARSAALAIMSAANASLTVRSRS